MSFIELDPDETFRFSCHPGVACFNACCRDLNQYLTPYDVLRLKQNLDLSSHELLKKYTERHRGPQTGLPVVSLKMYEADGYACPFVSPQGCTVYPDRPTACRTYPLGRIIRKKPTELQCRESFFLIRESHCQGFRERREWTIAEWKENQGLDPFNRMNDLMMEIVSLNNRNPRGPLGGEESDLLHMACYDTDRFRDFVFEKQLWEPMSLEEKDVAKTSQDDVALMRFGLDWVKMRLFGQTISKDRQASTAREST
jgi:Fe-S-cluster containining protein